MALGMKRWIGLVAAGCTLVALVALPPKTLEIPTRRNVPLQAERRLDALRSDVLAAHTTLQRLRWAEAVIPATLAGEGPVVFQVPEGATPEDAQRLRTHVLDEVKGDAPFDVAVGVFFRDPQDVGYPGAPTEGRVPTHYYFGRRDGRPYCVAVHAAGRVNAEGLVRLPPAPTDRSLLGVCALVRRYGLPGPAVRAWLAGGGTALAATATPGGGTLSLDFDVRDAAVARRRLLGRRDVVLGYLVTRVDYDRCFAGVAAGCAAMFLHPDLADDRWNPGLLAAREVRSLAPVSATQASSVFAPPDYHVAADLAEEFGPDRFTAWWTADGDVAEAFAASFGVEVGAWNLRRIATFVTIAKPGPGVSETGLTGGALLLALSTIVAGLWSRRRRVA